MTFQPSPSMSLAPRQLLDSLRTAFVVLQQFLFHCPTTSGQSPQSTDWWQLLTLTETFTLPE
jgi:hypothetical protein